MHQIQKFATWAVAEALPYFHQHGYVVFEDAFSAAEGDAFWADTEQQIAHNSKLTYSLYGQLYEGLDVPLEGRKLPRIIDLESHSAHARDLALAPTIVQFLRALYGGPPTCLQTLTYKYSSEQAAHSDLTLVAPPYAHDYDRGSLAASWLALEPSGDSNGALVIYPGSHKLAKRGFYDGFDNDYGRYVRYLEDLMASHGLQAQSFHARRGDVLFWHGDFVHAGGAIRAAADPVPTRKSLVCHYTAMPADVPSRDPVWVKRMHRGGAYFQKVAQLPA